MTFDAHALQELVALLLPFMGTEAECKSLYLLALGPNHPLLGQLNFNGAPQTVLTLALERTLAYGEAEEGVAALWSLLEVVRQQVGRDNQVRIDRFRALLGLPPIPLPDHVFVSYSRKNEAFARRIELDLQDAGLKVWFDRHKIRGGEEWQESILRGIARADFVVFCMSPDSLTSKNCHWELEMAQQKGKLIIPIMPIECIALLDDPAQAPIAWLQKLHILHFTQPAEYGRCFKELLAGLPAYNPPDGYYADALDSSQILNPFRGLEVFRELDYHYFAGREEAVKQLVARVQDPTKPRLLTVVGASGSGKSSLVRAGLIPTLRDVPNVQWETTIFKASAQPLKALAERLELRCGKSVSELHDMFLHKPASLSELIRETLSGSPGEVRFLLVVDQCEQIFAPPAEIERQPFLNLLLNAITEPQGPIHVLLTLRSDSFNHLSAYPELAKLVSDNQIITTVMTAEQFQRCIEVPAQKVGLMYEPGLVNELLADVLKQPGALPLLQYALKELYEQRRGRMLTKKAYDDMGKVQGALAARAETVFNELSQVQQNAMHGLLLQLVEVRETAVLRRARLSKVKLRNVTPSDLQAVVDVLTAEQARLLVANSPISDDDPTNDAEIDLEISHEALLTHWRRLDDWITDNKGALQQATEYRQLAQIWDDPKLKDTSYLLTGRRLKKALAWAEENDVPDLERTFIEDSSTAEAKAIADETRRQQQVNEATAQAEADAQRAKEAKKQAEAEAQRANEATLQASRNRRRMLGLAAALGVLVVIVGVILGQAKIRADQEQALIEQEQIRIATLKQQASGPMVVIPANDIQAAFSINQYEVTNAQYALCVEADVCAKPAEPAFFNYFTDPTKQNFPVVWVSAFDASSFCAWIDRRLPSAAEWEQALRGRTERLWPWGNEDPGPDQANIRMPDALVEPPALVAVDDERFSNGATPASEGHIMHLVGNAWEWTRTPGECRDDVSSCDASKLWNGHDDVQTLYLRGLSFMTSTSPIGSLNGELVGREPHESDMDIGFRCASS